MEVITLTKYKKNQVKRTSVILAFSEGMVEPIKNYLSRFIFQKKSGLLKNNFFIQGFQPPLLNVKPRSRFDMTYKINKTVR